MKKLISLIPLMLLISSANTMANENKDPQEKYKKFSFDIMTLFNSCNPFPQCEIHGLEPTAAKKFSPTRKLNPIKRVDRPFPRKVHSNTQSTIQ